MAITAIKSIKNDLTDDIYVRNNENPADADYTAVRPTRDDPFNMWVPWADNENQFNNGSNASQGPAHITIYWTSDGSDPIFSIWQQGDHVYYATGESYPVDAANRHFVDGNNNVGGDRSVEIIDKGAGPAPTFS